MALLVMVLDALIARHQSIEEVQSGAGLPSPDLFGGLNLLWVVEVAS